MPHVRLLDLNPDQRRETINTRQRYAAWRDAFERARSFRGSMVWSRTNGHEYLVRASYATGGRRQTSLGPRKPETERLKAEFEHGRATADTRLAELKPVLARQAAVNRALALGRVPRLGARIVRALDASGLLGNGIRVLGAYALYAYEAVAGVQLDTGLTTTEDIDLLFDARARLAVLEGDGAGDASRSGDASLLRILRRVDASFERARQTFRAVNRDGYMVDLIKPLRDPPWTDERTSLGDDADLAAVEIAGLEWLESAPSFEATAIDDRGEPLRLVTADPRVFAAHKHWLSGRPDREPIKRRRDGEQAGAVAALVAAHLTHLPFEASDLRMLPRAVLDAARPLFEPREAGERGV